MEAEMAILNDKDSEFLDGDESDTNTVVWSVNPLYNNNKNEIRFVADFNDSGIGKSCPRHNNDDRNSSGLFLTSMEGSSSSSLRRSSPRTEFCEAESGYSDELSFRDDSLSSSSYHSGYCSDEYSELQSVIDSVVAVVPSQEQSDMRKAKLQICSGNEREKLVINDNSKKISEDNNANLSQIISSKGTVRGVKNRVRESVLHFLSEPSSYQVEKNNKKDENPEKESNPDRGKVTMYTTSLGLIRKTQEECRYVKRVFHNLMVRTDERDLFVHPQFKQELQSRLNCGEIKLPKIFINGEFIGGAIEVENLIESGQIKKYLDKLERVSYNEATCANCGGHKYVNCSKCSGSGKSKRTRISREISSLKCSSCFDGIIACPKCNS